jgi:cob(I)alamin adenosyltransferase
MKIYTKKGDGGTTSLLGGTKVPKYDLRIEAYGTVDELNAYLGQLCDQAAVQAHLSLVREVQNKLFVIGSHLANDPDSKFELPRLNERDVERLERSMDHMDESLPALKNFVLPGGHPANSIAHVCRTICRRAERRSTELHEQSPVDPLILIYLNRLSDWLFMLSRHLSHQAGAAEIIWQP